VYNKNENTEKEDDNKIDWHQDKDSIKSRSREGRK
jgi:hypothetical protein